MINLILIYQVIKGLIAHLDSCSHLEFIADHSLHNFKES